jgi:hypothetical protein
MVSCLAKAALMACLVSLSFNPGTLNVTCTLDTRLSEVVELFLNSRAVTPVPGPGDEEVKDYMSPSVSDHGNIGPQISVLSGPHSSAGLNFTTASEIEPTPLEDSTEWDRVEGLNQGGDPAITDLGDSMVDISLNGGIATDAPAASLEAEASDLDMKCGHADLSLVICFSGLAACCSQTNS